jgi:hypothetical protein
VNKSQQDMDDAAEPLEMFRLIDGLEDIMPVDSASGTIHLRLRTEADAKRLAEAVERTRALHNRLVQQGKIAGRIIP